MRWLVAVLCLLSIEGYCTLAGGRPNTFSGGINAFAGVVNPANAVFVPDRVDVGAYLVHQNSTLNNKDNNPRLPPGKTDLTYKCKDLFTFDAAVNKHLPKSLFKGESDATLSLASYTLPTNTKIKTKVPFPSAGTTPIKVKNKIEALSVVFSYKINNSHAIGCSLDYFLFSHLRNGYQNSDNALRSVSPGNVTNNGMSHASGLGLALGWRWNITNRIAFGIAWTKKTYAGQYKKYRGYEPRFAENFTPETVGAGFGFKLTEKIAGRIEMLWTDYGNLPGKNNNILKNGLPNISRKGSKHSPGPGLQDATLINLGMGYKVNEALSFGAGYSHRLKGSKSKNMLSHSYRFQTIYDIVTFGIDYKLEKHEVLLVLSKGLENKVSGHLPAFAGGGKLVTSRETASLSLSYGYQY